jgi:hypothetical protein
MNKGPLRADPARPPFSVFSGLRPANPLSGRRRGPRRSRESAGPRRMSPPTQLSIDGPRCARIPPALFGFLRSAPCKPALWAPPRTSAFPGIRRAEENESAYSAFYRWSALRANPARPPFFGFVRVASCNPLSGHEVGCRAGLRAPRGTHPPVSLEFFSVRGDARLLARPLPSVNLSLSSNHRCPGRWRAVGRIEGEMSRFRYRGGSSASVNSLW